MPRSAYPGYNSNIPCCQEGRNGAAFTPPAPQLYFGQPSLALIRHSRIASAPKRGGSGISVEPVSYNTKMSTLQDRFWAKVFKTDGCWNWTGAHDITGYGRIGAGGSAGKILSAHRLSYEWFKGLIPDGCHVMHTCDNPRCVRPEHLKIGSHTENVRDMDLKMRRHSKLSPREVLEIRSLLGTMKQKEIGAKFGVSKYLISRIKLRKSWASI